MSRHRLLKAGAEVTWVAAGQLVAFVGAFAALKIFTGQLGAEQYGQLALGMSVAGLVHMFIYGPIEQTALRFVSVYRERGDLGLLLAILRKIHLWSAIAVILGAICAAIFAQVAVGGKWAPIVFLGTLFGLVNGINATAASLRSALRQQVSVTWFQAFDVWSRLLLACAALLYLNTAANAVLLGFCVATAAIAVVQLALVARNPVVRPHLGARPRAQAEGEAFSEIVKYGHPYLAFAAFMWLGTYADRWIILSAMDEKSVGIYAAIFQIANAPILLFVGITNQVLVPRVFERAGSMTTEAQVHTSGRLLNLALAIYVAALTVTVAGAAFLGEPIVRILTNAEFAGHARLLWIICAGLGLFNIAQLLTVKGLSFNRPGKYVWPKAAHAAILLLSSLLLVGVFGLVGVALALCVSGACYVAIVVFVNRGLRIDSSRRVTGEGTHVQTPRF